MSTQSALNSTQNVRTRNLHIQCDTNQMQENYNFICAPVDKQTLKTPCCSYFAPLPLDVTNLRQLPERKNSVLYLMQPDTNQQCNVHFPHIYTNNHNRVLTFLCRAGRKHKHVPQMHQTEKTDRNFGFENAYISAGMPCTVCKWKLSCLSQCKVLCQMHAHRCKRSKITKCTTGQLSSVL
jgi:hypothetical protein